MARGSISNHDQVRLKRLLRLFGSGGSASKTAADELAASDDSVLCLLAGAIEQLDTGSKRRLITAAKRARRTALVDVLVVLMGDSRADVRLAATKAVGGMGTPQCIDALIRSVRGGPVMSRQVKSLLFGALNASQSFRELGIVVTGIQGDEGKPFGDWQAAKVSLERLDEAMPKVAAIIQDDCAPHEPAVVQFAEVLVQLANRHHNTSFEIVADVLRSVEECAQPWPNASYRRDLRCTVVKAIGATNDRRGVALILPLVDDKDLSVAGTTAETLGTFGDLSALPALLKRMKKTRNQQLRFDLAVGAAMLGDETAYEEVKASVGDDFHRLVALERVQRVRQDRAWRERRSLRFDLDDVAEVYEPDAR